MKRRIVAGLIIAAVLSGPVQAQDQTLADIRQELTVLFVELQNSGVSCQQRVVRAPRSLAIVCSALT